MQSCSCFNSLTRRQVSRYHYMVSRYLASQASSPIITLLFLERIISNGSPDISKDLTWNTNHCNRAAPENMSTVSVNEYGIVFFMSRMFAIIELMSDVFHNKLVCQVTENRRAWVCDYLENIFFPFMRLTYVKCTCRVVMCVETYECR